MPPPASSRKTFNPHDYVVDLAGNRVAVNSITDVANIEDLEEIASAQRKLMR